MRWPWRWGDDEKPDGAASHALRAAEEAKARAEAQWPDVRRQARELGRHREQNHFAEMFIRAMERKP